MILKQFVRHRLKQWEAEKSKPIRLQEQIFSNLVRQGEPTHFGKEHGFAAIRHYDDFRRNVPLRDYDEFIPYIEQIAAGHSDVLWPGKPRYFAKSSGTVASVKYLPVSPASAKTYATSGLNMLCAYAACHNRFGLLTSNKIFIQGSPALEEKSGILTGRMSGISYHLVPRLLRFSQLPRYQTNIIADWEEKVKAIARETRRADLRIVAGIPPWVMMYFDELMLQTGKKTVVEIFPNLNLYIHGGVNFEPYRKLMLEKLGKRLDTLDTYTASEGFFGFQELPEERAMTLCCNNGMFYEFVALENMHRPNPPRIPLEEVQTGRDYALIISTASGLWGYLIGDTIRFTEKYPFKFVVAGRVAEFTSLFGEHVIEQEVRTAMREATEAYGLRVKYFTVAPYLSGEAGKSHHEWWIEFEQMPPEISPIAERLDAVLCRLNPYYQDLIAGNILAKLKSSRLPLADLANAFGPRGNWMAKTRFPF